MSCVSLSGVRCFFFSSEWVSMDCVGGLSEIKWHMVVFFSTSGLDLMDCAPVDAIIQSFAS